MDFPNDLLGKTEGQCDENRIMESMAFNTFKMVKSAIKDEIKFTNKGTSAAKKNLAERTVKKTAAKDDLDATSDHCFDTLVQTSVTAQLIGI